MNNERVGFKVFTDACKKLNCTQKALATAMGYSDGILHYLRRDGLSANHVANLERVLENPGTIQSPGHPGSYRPSLSNEPYGPMKEQLRANGIRVADLAAMLGLNKATVYLWKKRGVPKQHADRIREILADKGVDFTEYPKPKPQMNGYDTVADDQPHKVVVHGVLKDPAQWDMFCAMVEMFCEEGATIVEV